MFKEHQKHNILRPHSQALTATTRWLGDMTATESTVVSRYMSPLSLKWKMDTNLSTTTVKQDFLCNQIPRDKQDCNIFMCKMEV